MPRWALLLSMAVLFVVAMVAVVVVLRRSHDGGPIATGPTPAPGSVAMPDGIELLFTTPLGGNNRAPTGAPGRLDERLTALIDGARTSVDMAIYDLRLDNVADALVRAHQRSVRVRLVTDTDNVEDAQLKRVKGAGVPVVADGRGPLMHHKFTVIDGEVVLTGSWNYAPNDTFRYNNHTAVIRSRPLAENYTAEFEKMFTRRSFGPTKPKDVPHPRIVLDGAVITTIFEAEGDAAGPIVERIRGARHSVAFLAFTFTHDDIGRAIEERFAAGVAVRGVIENLQSERPEGELGRLVRAGLGAAQPAGVPLPECVAGPAVLTDGNPQLMHHKVIIIDGTVAIFGSLNFTANATTDNDENVLIIESPAIAAAFSAEFCRVYNVAVEAKNRR